MNADGLTALAVLGGLLLIAALVQGGIEYIRRGLRARKRRREMVRVIRAARLAALFMATLGGAFAKSVKVAQDFNDAMERVQRTLDAPPPMPSARL